MRQLCSSAQTLQQNATEGWTEWHTLIFTVLDLGVQVQGAFKLCFIPRPFHLLCRQPSAAGVLTEPVVLGACSEREAGASSSSNSSTTPVRTGDPTFTAPSSKVPFPLQSHRGIRASTYEFYEDRNVWFIIALYNYLCVFLQDNHAQSFLLKTQGLLLMRWLANDGDEEPKEEVSGAHGSRLPETSSRLMAAGLAFISTIWSSLKAIELLLLSQIKPPLDPSNPLLTRTALSKSYLWGKWVFISGRIFLKTNIHSPPLADPPWSLERIRSESLHPLIGTIGKDGNGMRCVHFRSEHLPFMW